MDRQEDVADTSRILTIPNVLSLIRLAGVPLFLWLALGPKADGWALLVLGVSGITDYFDGVLARKLNQVSEVGKILDPIADRLYILAVLVALGLRDIIPWWLVVAIPFRDYVFLAIVLFFLRRNGFGPLPVHFLGKAATFCLMYAFGLLFIGEFSGTIGDIATVAGWAFAIWGTALYWWAGLLYAYQAFYLVRQKNTSRGPSNL